MALIYTTVDGWNDYTSLPVVGWTDETSLLEEAQDLIDLAVGRYPVDPTTGLKFVPATMLAPAAASLSLATIYQGEYMLIKGPEFFIEEVPLDPSGPDGSQKGREPLLAPKARRKLSQAGLFNLIGRSQVPFPNQNWQDYVP